jgi:exosome complex exonuclease RRP6
MTTAGPSTSRSPPKTETFATFHTGLQAAALKATRASAGLPVDLDFYKSVDEGIKKNVDRLEGRVLELLGRCIALADGKGKGKEVRVEGEDLVDDFHGTVVDFVDVLLEKTVRIFIQYTVVTLKMV